MSQPCTIDVLLREGRRFPPQPEFQSTAYIKNPEEYERLYEWSVTDPEGFWSKTAEEIYKKAPQ